MSQIDVARCVFETELRRPASPKRSNRVGSPATGKFVAGLLARHHLPWDEPTAPCHTSPHFLDELGCLRAFARTRRGRPRKLAERRGCGRSTRTQLRLEDATPAAWSPPCSFQDIQIELGLSSGLLYFCEHLGCVHKGPGWRT
eukprot:354470-Chlamydomonas_euryale.AAC.15